MSRPPSNGGAATLSCYRCEYDLAGLGERGRCPECGLAVEESMRVVGAWSARRAGRLRVAAMAYLVAALSWCGFGVMLVATRPSSTTRVVAGSLVGIHAIALLVACLVGTAAVSRRTKRVRWAIVGTLSALFLVAASTVVVGLLQVSPFVAAPTPLFLSLAALVRAAAVATATWWLVTSLATLSALSSQALATLRCLVVVAALPWLVLALYVVPFNPGWLGPALAFRNVGEPVMWIDAAALCGGSIVAIGVLRLLRSLPGRTGSAHRADPSTTP